MSGADPEAFPEAFDEFDFIAEVLRPLTVGAPESLGLFDDVAIIQPRMDKDLVVSADALVEGVHFLRDDPPDLVARKALRANLSDLAAKAAEPYGYFLCVCWPYDYPLESRRLFAAGLAQEQAAYELQLFGGDTTGTPGPLTVAITILGRVGPDQTVRRTGAVAGDRLLVSGTIGDGWLGLQAARGELDWLGAEPAAWLADRYRLPQPRLALGPALQEHAAAAADVSDGLPADAGHIGEASGAGVRIDLERLPLSDAARAWLKHQPDRAEGLAALAAGGDDYEVVCAVPPAAAKALIEAARGAGVAMTDVGEVTDDGGISVRFDGEAMPLAPAGWRHG